MASTNFIDYVKICCRSGKGGAGSAHLRRDRLTPRGGPDGGDGGRGGHIIIRGNPQFWTLLHLKYQKHVIAENGGVGSRSRSTGANGKDIILEVPLGTVARDVQTGEIEGEIIKEGQEIILTAGGRGGQGNFHFKSPVNQTPRYAQPGEAGAEEWKVLELKLLADIGLVGFPNAGKSTLLASLSAAKPKIADYAFTTLTPNLGIVAYRDSKSFVMADIPGIIEGAHLGKGLGHQFLRHIERNSGLLFVIPADSDDCLATYHILLDELEKYDPSMLDKPRFVGLSKADLVDEGLKELISAEMPDDLPHLYFSAVTGEGLDALKDALWSLLTK